MSKHWSTLKQLLIWTYNDGKDRQGHKQYVEKIIRTIEAQFPTISDDRHLEVLLSTRQADLVKEKRYIYLRPVQMGAKSIVPLASFTLDFAGAKESLCLYLLLFMWHNN